MAFCPVCRKEYPDDWKRCPKDEAVLLGGPSIGKYRIDTMIGSGGMGAVYRATNPDTGAPVAVKLLHPSASAHDDVRARFRREAASVSKLRTRHVIRVYDFGNDGDTLYLVMEFLEGHPLRAEIAGSSKSQPIPGPRVDLAIDGALRGLAAAHKGGVTHRDLKPENIFIADTDDGEVSKVLDFGIARVEDTNLTNSGTVMGTPAYMAPEQVAGDTSRIGPWTDCYAMGVIIYEMLTGEAPFAAETVTAVLARIMAREFRPLRELRSDLPEDLYRLVDRALQPNIEARFESAAEMRQAWSAAVGGSRLVAGPIPEFSPVVDSGSGESSREDIELGGTIEAGGEVDGSSSNGEQGGDNGEQDGGRRADVGQPPDERHQQGGGEPPEQRDGPPSTTRDLGGEILGYPPPVEPEQPRSRLPTVLLGLAVVGGGIIAAVTLSGGDDSPAAATETQPADAAAEPTSIDAAPPALPDAAIGPSVPDGMAVFAGGKLEMGTPKKFSKMPDADPVHEVEVEPFYLDELEFAGEDGLPLRGVQWAEAAAKCKEVGKRLPTEEEWEYAATRTKLAPGAAALDQKAPARVGTHPGDCTEEGVCDLLGNVLEWTSSDFREKGELVAGKKTVRGSSFGASREGGFFASVHARIGVEPDRDRKDLVEVGFRCARTARD